MHDPKMIELIDVLLSKTREGHVNWKPASEISDEEFHVVQKNSVLTIQKKYISSVECIEMIVYDSNGRIVSHISGRYTEGWDVPFSFSHDEYERALSELFYRAQRQALQTDLVIDDIISSFR